MTSSITSLHSCDISDRGLATILGDLQKYFPGEELRQFCLIWEENSGLNVYPEHRPPVFQKLTVRQSASRVKEECNDWSCEYICHDLVVLSG